MAMKEIEISRNEEIFETVAKLIKDVDRELQNNSNTVKDLEQQARSLLPHAEETDLSSNSTSAHGSVEAATELDEEIMIIRLLEKERLDKIRSLEQQEYIGAKLRELVGENELIVTHIKDYIYNKERERQRVAQSDSLSCEWYKKKVIEPKISFIDSNTQTLKSNRRNLETLLQRLSSDIEKDFSTSENSEISKNLDAIDEALKAFSKSYD
ncbi:Piso0_000896 [Millerozyma farinosa CBS 7064]|uniref:Piso0_000896 protein n=1 Tax=Pichia sorbitophila (strain ATCC MYA-4447 / BCRC 22081 / CBS 7064 / NBRC 10061 / NRRL Y-12695) TaxID=559304 RepID=G8YRU0_PICSO|nr:Piso0_000896 [Millerozyma farinosa CBS 7064]